MNKWQKEVTQSQLNDETAVIRDLKRVYDQARKDCQERIEALNSRKDLQNLQSIIYQKQYQQALKDQLDGICDALNADQFATVSEYLAKTYQSGYVGTMYDLHKQGIPIITPIRQDQVVKAVQLDSKISKGLYAKMGEDVAGLKKSIRSELSRGISNGSSWLDIAGNIANGMNSPFNKALNRTVLIARTEGHRIQQEAAWEAQKVAKEKGANVVKQWCATLDDKTRETHQQLDGKIVEVDEPFTLPGGLSAMFPGDFGDPAEDCNCRCQVLQRAKWALDEDELAILKERAEFFGLDKTQDFEEFKEKYLGVSDVAEDKSLPLDITENGKYMKWDTSDKNEYADLIEHDYTTQKATTKEVNQLWARDGGYIQNAEGYKDINAFLRGQKNQIENPKCRITERVLTRLTNNNALKEDHIGFRKVDMNYLRDVLGLDTSGLSKNSRQPTSQGRKRMVEIPNNRAAASVIANKINELVGTERGTITDKAYTSVSLSENLNFFTHYPVQFEIQMPNGTKGFLTSNLDESEFITKKDSAIEIMGAEVYNDGNKNCIRIFGKMVQDGE